MGSRALRQSKESLMLYARPKVSTRNEIYRLLSIRNSGKQLD